jgi:hypothetical protein
VFGVNVLGTLGVEELVADSSQESLTQLPLTLHAGINLETVEVCSGKLENNELSQSGDVGRLDLTWRWDRETKSPIALGDPQRHD